jgi:hypothetical protein
MDTGVTTTIVSTSGAVITGVLGMFFTANQLGRRIDDIANQLGRRIDDTGKRIDDLRGDIKELRSEFYAFKDVVNGKLTTLDTEIAKLMDRRNLE